MSMSNTKKYVKDIRPNMPWEKADVNKEWHGMEYKKDYPSFILPTYLQHLAGGNCLTTRKAVQIYLNGCD